MDIFEKASRYTRAKEAIDLGVYPYFQPFAQSESNKIQFKGREVIMLGSNNYLGLTTHPKILKAAEAALYTYGSSCTGSRYMNGTLDLHLELEQRLAQFVGKEAALVFSTGYQTNLGVISAIVQKNDYAILDKEAHACLVDGSMLALGQTRRFLHNDMNSLERVLKNLPDDSGKLVIVDGIYSMGGEIAPLPDIVQICKEYGARLLVDDAHSIGVLANGRGTAAHFGLSEQVDLITGTFSKSLASIGGFVAGDAEIIHFIQHHARSLMFSASTPATNAAMVLAALDVIEGEPELINSLWENAEFMRTGLKELGYNTGLSTTPIIPIIIGDDDYRTVLTWHALVDAGVYTNPVVTPAVPPDKNLLRTSYMATHTKEVLQEALYIFEQVGRNLDVIPSSHDRVSTQ